MSCRIGGELLDERRVAKRMQAAPDLGLAPSAVIVLPNTSNRQISPHRSGLSSSPTIHTEAIEVCDSSIRARTSMRP